MGDAGASLVDFVGVEKSYGAVRALDGVDFSAWPGECVGVVGHNGAGKSTLMHILNGGVAPDRGRLVVAGQEERSHWTSARAKSARAAPGLPGALALPEPDRRRERPDRPSCRSADLAGGAGRGGSFSTSSTRFFPGHGIEADDLVQDLSIGRRQMVEIARAFTVSAERPARLVILDEPTSALDAHTAGTAARLCAPRGRDRA